MTAPIPVMTTRCRCGRLERLARPLGQAGVTRHPAAPRSASCLIRRRVLPAMWSTNWGPITRSAAHRPITGQRRSRLVLDPHQGAPILGMEGPGHLHAPRDAPHVAELDPGHVGKEGLQGPPADRDAVPAGRHVHQLAVGGALQEAHPAVVGQQLGPALHLGRQGIDLPRRGLHPHFAGGVHGRSSVRFIGGACLGARVAAGTTGRPDGGPRRPGGSRRGRPPGDRRCAAGAPAGAGRTPGAGARAGSLG